MNKIQLVFAIVCELFDLLVVIFSYINIILYYILIFITKMKYFMMDQDENHEFKILISFIVIIFTLKYLYKFHLFLNNNSKVDYYNSKVDYCSTFVHTPIKKFTKKLKKLER